MRKKRGTRRSNRRGKGTPPARIAASVVCAVAVCALIVGAVSFGAYRIIDKKDVGETVDIAAEDMHQGMMPKPEKKQMTQEVSQTGTTISILGDSISTFRDYIPAGYYDFFPDNGAVSDINDTWWRRLLNETEWTLYVNGSSSGATCTGDSTGRTDPQCGCNELRTGALYGPNGEVPDVIIVYMGTNDLLQSIPMGDNDGTKEVAEGQISTFADAYTLMLDKLMAKYPSSAIYCCTITQIGDYGTATPYVEFVNGEGLTAADYSARITLIAASKKLPVIDLYSCGITVDNLHNTSSDGVHPTPDGMKYIADAVRKALD